MPSPSVTTHTSLPLTPRHTRPTGQRQKGSTVEDTRGLTVLEGAAMVSISSWVTHTLPDGYRTGGAEPKKQSSSSRVGSRGPVGGASSVKEEEQHHCKPIVL